MREKGFPLSEWTVVRVGGHVLRNRDHKLRFHASKPTNGQDEEEHGISDQRRGRE